MSCPGTVKGCFGDCWFTQVFSWDIQPPVLGCLGSNGVLFAIGIVWTQYDDWDAMYVFTVWSGLVITGLLYGMCYSHPKWRLELGKRGGNAPANNA
jgi:hypothetical protein